MIHDKRRISISHTVRAAGVSGTALFAKYRDDRKDSIRRVWGAVSYKNVNKKGEIVSTATVADNYSFKQTMKYLSKIHKIRINNKTWSINYPSTLKYIEELALLSPSFFIKFRLLIQTGYFL